MYCCEKCFKDRNIVEYITDKNTLGNCDFCKSKNVHICDTDNLCFFIQEGIERGYKIISDNDKGDSLINLLYYRDMIFSDYYNFEKASKLLNTLLSNTNINFDITKRCINVKKDLCGVEFSEYYLAWEEFKYLCRSFNRYFDLSEDKRREKLLKSLEPIFKMMETDINSNKQFYRVRRFNAKEENINSQEDFDLIDINQYISPAPYIYSKNNRMSPAGISYLYVSDTSATSIKEGKARIGDTVLLGKLTLTNNIKIVDLSKLSLIYDGSIFSKHYSYKLLWFKEFIRKFTSEISKPVKENDKELEYIATQVLAEYIRKIGYDGLRFKSSLDRKHYNYVMFCGPLVNNNDFMKNYRLIEYTKWFKVNQLYYGRVNCKDQLDLIYSK